MIRSVLNTIVNPNNEPLTFELKVKRDLMNEENKTEVLSFKV